MFTQQPLLSRNNTFPREETVSYPRLYLSLSAYILSITPRSLAAFFNTSAPTRYAGFLLETIITDS
jgi:hypothetical protein